MNIIEPEPGRSFLLDEDEEDTPGFGQNKRDVCVMVHGKEALGVVLRKPACSTSLKVWQRHEIEGGS